MLNRNPLRGGYGYQEPQGRMWMAEVLLYLFIVIERPEKKIQRGNPWRYLRQFFHMFVSVCESSSMCN